MTLRLVSRLVVIAVVILQGVVPTGELAGQGRVNPDAARPRPASPKMPDVIPLPGYTYGQSYALKRIPDWDLGLLHSQLPRFPGAHGITSVEAIGGFDDPDELERLTRLSFCRSIDVGVRHVASWALNLEVTPATRSLVFHGYPYEVKRTENGDSLKKLSIDSEFQLPDRLEGYFSIPVASSLSLECLQWQAPANIHIPARRESVREGVVFNSLAFEEKAGLHAAQVEIIASETINGERSTLIDLLEAPEQLLVWKNRYRVRVGDVIRTNRLKFIVRRIVPPDENGRHSGWVDVENVFGMVIDPKGIPASPPLPLQTAPSPPEPNQPPPARRPFDVPPPNWRIPPGSRPNPPPEDDLPEFGNPQPVRPPRDAPQPFRIPPDLSPDAPSIPLVINLPDRSAPQTELQTRIRDWPPRAFAQVRATQKFDDPAQPDRMTTLAFLRHYDTGPLQTSLWSMQFAITPQTQLVPIHGHPYELTELPKGYRLQRSEPPPQGPAAEVSPNTFSVRGPFYFTASTGGSFRYDGGDSRLIKEDFFLGEVLRFERIGPADSAIVQAVTYELTRRGSDHYDFLQAPARLLVWQNAYRVRVGDVFRTRKLQFTVRRIVPPAEDGRHNGWIDLER